MNPAPGGGSSKPSTPAPAPVNTKKPELGPYVKLERERDLLIRTTIRLDSDSMDAQTVTGDGKVYQRPSGAVFSFKEMHVLFPVLPQTGSSTSNIGKVTGRLMLDDQPVDESVEAMKALYHAGVQFARLDFPDPSMDASKTNTTKQVTIEFVVPVTTHTTRFDEKNAMEVRWPNGPYPADVATTLQPQMYVDMAPPPLPGVPAPTGPDAYDGAVVQKFIDVALAEAQIRDPKSVSPVYLAKAITRAVWEKIQPTGNGLRFRPRTGELQGIDLQGPAMTIIDGRGSEFDSVVVLAAALRRAGLPTRLLIGYEASDKSDRFLQETKRGERLRAWVEFYLYDEPNNTFNWITVDLTRMRRMTTRPPGLDKNWKFFGTHDEFDRMVPFAAHFHPPTDVMSYGAPAFWGWNVTPRPPVQALQAISFETTTAPKRAGDREEKEKEKKKDKGFGK